MPIEELTRLLRTSNDQPWRRLRETLGKRGLDPGGAVLAFSSPRLDETEFAVIVFPGVAVWQLLLDWDDENDAGLLIEWNDLSASWMESPYRAEVERAITVLRTRNAPSPT